MNLHFYSVLPVYWLLKHCKTLLPVTLTTEAAMRDAMSTFELSNSLKELNQRLSIYCMTHSMSFYSFLLNLYLFIYLHHIFTTLIILL